MPTTPPTVTPLPNPPDPNDRSSFNLRAYPWSVAQQTFGTEMAALAANVFSNATDATTQATAADTQATNASNSAATAAAAAATASATVGASVWVTGTTYAVGDTRWSPANFQVYRRKTVGAGATDPSLDPTNWTRLGDTSGLGSPIASAATLVLDSAASDFFHVTGTTTITAITLTSGVERTVVFDGVLTLTHNATTLILPGGANITTAAGDRATFRGDGAGNVRCIHYTKASGLPLNLNIPISLPTLHVRDEKAAGSNGGAGSGSPATRVLNTVVTNTVSGASLSTNIITLPAGTYDVLAAAPGGNQNAGTAYKLVLYNNTAAADVLVGWSQQSLTSGANTIAEVRGRFTLGVSSALVLRHYGSFPNANTTELGIASNLASKTEVYAEAIFFKVG